MIDLELGSVDVIKASPIGTTCKVYYFVFGASGVGNNWAKGHSTECAHNILNWIISLVMSGNTTGRLKDYVSSGTAMICQVKYCVLDEADRMLDIGFLPQIKEIIYEMPKKDSRNTLMFSATFPDAIQMMAQEFMKEDYIFIAIGKVGATNSFINQKLVHIENHKKVAELIDLLPECKGLTLIFVEKKRDAASVERELINCGFNAVSIAGDRNQHERENALKLFCPARVPVVATNVAARGLDIPNVLYVINYDLPNNIDSYVHRIGRTGRCGDEGNAISFVNKTNKPILSDLMKN